MTRYICMNCGEVFRRKPAQGKKNSAGKPMFCSLECSCKHNATIAQRKNTGAKYGKNRTTILKEAMESE